MEDSERDRERDVSRKETVFKSLIMCKVRGLLTPFTTAQIKRRQEKISLCKERHLDFPCMCATVEISSSGMPEAQDSAFVPNPFCAALSCLAQPAATGAQPLALQNHCRERKSSLQHSQSLLLSDDNT